MLRRGKEAGRSKQGRGVKASAKRAACGQDGRAGAAPRFPEGSGRPEAAWPGSMSTVKCSRPFCRPVKSRAQGPCRGERRAPRAALGPRRSVLKAAKEHVEAPAPACCDLNSLAAGRPALPGVRLVSCSASGRPGSGDSQRAVAAHTAGHAERAGGKLPLLYDAPGSAFPPGCRGALYPAGTAAALAASAPCLRILPRMVAITWA